MLIDLRENWPHLAIILGGLMILTASLANAQSAAKESVQVQSLTEQNIKQFLETIKDVSLGKVHTDTGAYLDRHLTEEGEYKSLTRYEIPGYPAQEGEMHADKSKYIANIMEGQGLLKNYDTTIEIKSLNISADGRTAMLATVGQESGKLLWPDGEGGKKPLPVKGISKCDQRIVLSDNNYIQMDGATCRSDIVFSPYKKEKFSKKSIKEEFYAP